MRTAWRQKFDRDRDFIVRRAITFNGYYFEPGQPFNKTLASTRRLRQLFERHVIIYADEPPPGSIVVPKEPDPVQTLAEGAAALLEDMNGLDKDELHRRAIALLGPNAPSQKFRLRLALKKLINGAA